MTASTSREKVGLCEPSEVLPPVDNGTRAKKALVQLLENIFIVKNCLTAEKNLFTQSFVQSKLTRVQRQ
jgi:hypothetical protein